MTDDEAFEEPLAQERCPACLAAVEPHQQYCLQCGERLAPVGPSPSSPLGGRSRPPAAAIIAIGAALLLLGGFGIAYGFTRDDKPKAAGTTLRTGASTGVAVPSTVSLTETGPVPTFTETTASTGGFVPTDTGPSTTRTDTGFTDTTPTVPTESTGTTAPAPNTGTETNDWPSGRDAFAVLLSSDDTTKFTYASIVAKKARARGKGFTNAGVLNSDDYFTLNPGYWVLYLGPYPTKAAALAAEPKARTDGYPDAYVRRVAE